MSPEGRNGASAPSPINQRRETMKDFRIIEKKRIKQHGIDYLMCVCEELIDGRWEGFVSLRPLKKGERQ